MIWRKLKLEIIEISQGRYARSMLETKDIVNRVQMQVAKLVKTTQENSSDVEKPMQ